MCVDPAQEVGMQGNSSGGPRCLGLEQARVVETHHWAHQQEWSHRRSVHEGGPEESGWIKESPREDLIHSIPKYLTFSLTWMLY